MNFLEAGTYSEQLPFQKRNLFRSRHFLKKVTSDSLTLKFPNPLLLKIANDSLISIVLQMCLFENLVAVSVS